LLFDPSMSAKTCCSQVLPGAKGKMFYYALLL